MGGLFGSATQAKQKPSISGLNIQTSAFGAAKPIVYGTTRLAPNLIWYGDFAAIPHNSSPSGVGKGGVGGGGGGKGGGGGSVSYTYQTALALALCEGPISGVGGAWSDKNLTTPAALGLTVFTGAYPQAPWGYLSTNHHGQDLGYNGTAYVAGAPYQLGNSAQIPNHNFEVQGVLRGRGGASGTPDADPSLVIADLLTNPFYGAGFPAARVGSLSQYQQYCQATGLFISPAYTDQRSASDILDEIAKNTNSAFVWTGGKLTLVPYGDQPVTGNGVTFTPNLTPIYNLTDDDFLENANASGGSSASSTDPILVTRKRPADALNSIKLEFLNRANQYNPEIVEAKDQAAIDLYGLRQDSSRQAHLFASAAAANLSVTLQLQREAVRNIYQFTLGAWAILLDPMDIVSLTDSYLGLNQQPVRILEIQENDGGTLSFTAEELLTGTGTAVARSFQTGAGAAPNYNDAPPNTNPPIIFGAPVALAQGGLALWLAASGNGNWGGCDVWVSFDGNTYRNVGRITGPARQGVLTAAFSSGSDPDTTDTLAVDLTMSGGTLLSGTQQDADLGHTLCYVDGELVSYEAATLTGTNQYSLGTYLRRGQYGTAIKAHLSGTPFARLDSGIFEFDYTKDQIGKTISIKLPAFNIYGGGQQSLAQVNAVSITLPPPPPPPNVVNFSAVQNGEVVAFAWGDVSDNAIVGYDIRFGPAGTTEWNQLMPLTEALRGTEMTNASVPAGAWSFAIRAHDIADQLSPLPAFATITVVNTQLVLSQVDEAPAWPGTTVGFVRHYNGALIPDSTSLAGADTGTAVFDNFVWNPVAQSSYTSRGITLSKAALLRTWAIISDKLGPGDTTGNVNPLLYVRVGTNTDPAMWTGDGNPMWAADPTTLMWGGLSAFMPWTKGNFSTSFVQHQVVVNASDGVQMLTDFTPVVDQPPITDGANGVTAAAGGQRINFANPNFLTPPFVTVSPTGTTAASATATAVDALGFTAHVFNSSGTDVGGTVNWSAHN